MCERMTTIPRTAGHPWQTVEVCGTPVPPLSVGRWALCRTGTGRTEFWTGHLDGARPVPTPSPAAAVTWATRQEAAEAAEALPHDGWAPVNLNEIEED